MMNYTVAADRRKAEWLVLAQSKTVQAPWTVVLAMPTLNDARAAIRAFQDCPEEVKRAFHLAGGCWNGHKPKRNGGRIMSMRGFWLGLAVGTISTCLVGQWVVSAAGKESDPPKCISSKTVADYIHSVVQADRTGEATETSPYPPNFYSNRGGSWRNNQMGFDSG